MGKSQSGGRQVAPGRGDSTAELKELWPGQSIDLLKELHILTRDGKLNQDSRRKLKQVQHLVQLMAPALEGLDGAIVDLGAGKSYLGFMLYDLLLRERENTWLLAVEARTDLIERCRAIAKSSSFKRISFIGSTIESASEAEEVPETVAAVTALHACDTATDDAILFAVKKEAKVIALVPCCQAEVARLLEKVEVAQDAIGQLWRHPIHRREFGSHLTNVIRSLYLEARGYRVRVTELIGWEHSMKNEMILAQKIQRSNPRAQAQLDELLSLFPLPMKLLQSES